MFSFPTRKYAAVAGRPKMSAGVTNGAGVLCRVALALTVVIFGLLLLDNWHYLFRTEIYESSDWASNSLFARDAKSGVLLHGHYSRWNFYHPGPVLLYVYALGEAVLYDWLHVVPTPYNGQVIVLSLAMTMFFSFALSVFAQRLGRARGGYLLFLPLALLFAIWHFGSAAEVRPFMETWPASTLVLPFLCFLVTVAATASGSGVELPLVVLSGGWLVHNHVAQPIFVVPLTLLAYAGLLVSLRHRPLEPGGVLRALTAGWRTNPRAHILAGGILAVFILPVLVDALKGSQSNLSDILAHLRTQHEPPKKLLRSFCYFLIFGTYAGYNPPQNYFGKYSAAGMCSFLALHWRVYLCWGVALVAPPVLFILSRRGPVAPAPAGSGRETPSTFIPWFYIVVVCASALTLIWGMNQDGEMYYFNAYFNYSIYYCLALALAAGLAVSLTATVTSLGLAHARPALGAVLWLGLAAVTVRDASSFHYTTFDLSENRTAAHSVELAAKVTLPPGATCFLDWDPPSIWPAAIQVALQLERLGHPVRVNSVWATMIGRKRTLKENGVDFSRPIRRWRVLPVARDPAHLGRWPVQYDCGILACPISDISPASGNIRFAGDGNYTDFAYSGWAPTADNWTWTEQRYALLQFRPLPLPENAIGGVDMIIDAWSFTTPTHPRTQRMEIVLDGVALQTTRLPPLPDQPVRVHIRPEIWRNATARGSATMLFCFPDAISPSVLGFGGDSRSLGGGFRNIEFRLSP